MDAVFCSIEELKDLYPCLSVKFITDGHTVGWKWLTGCGDLASWIFFMEVSKRITSGWVFVPMITTFRYLLDMWKDKHCGTENKYRNIKDHNKFSTSNDMPLLCTPFWSTTWYFSYLVHFFHAILSVKWKITQVWCNFCIFALGFIEKKLSEQAVVGLEYKLKRCSNKECCKQCRYVMFKGTLTKWPVQKLTQGTTQKEGTHVIKRQKVESIRKLSILCSTMFKIWKRYFLSNYIYTISKTLHFVGRKSGIFWKINVPSWTI